MGCSRSYYIDKMKAIYKVYGMGSWRWSDAHALGVSEADLRRLNYSDWFVKVKDEKYRPTRLWRLTSDAEELLI